MSSERVGTPVRSKGTLNDLKEAWCVYFEEKGE